MKKLFITLAVAIMAIGFSSCGSKKSDVNLDSPADAVESYYKGMQKNDPSIMVKCLGDKNGNAFDEAEQKKAVERATAEIEEEKKYGKDDYYGIKEYKIEDVFESEGNTKVKVSYKKGEWEDETYFLVKKGDDGKWRVYVTDRLW